MTENLFIYLIGFTEVFPPCLQAFFPVRNLALSGEKGDMFTARGSAVVMLSHVRLILVWSYSTGWDIRRDAVISIQHDCRLCVISMVSGVICCFSFCVLLRNSDQLFAISLRKNTEIECQSVLRYLCNQLVYFPSLCILHLWAVVLKPPPAVLRQKWKKLWSSCWLIRWTETQELPMRALCMSETGKHGNVQIGPN